VHSTDDPELVRRSIAGEAAAFAQLVERHQRLVFGVALSGARDAAIAEEVAQEAFVEAWRDLPRLRDPGRVGTWIAGIARNLAKTWSRTAARRRARTPAVTAELAAPPATPLDSALERESHALVRQALDEIPAAYREVLVLFYVQGRSVAEVAAGLGISEELAKQRLHRGRAALRSTLESRVEGELDRLRPSKAFTSAVMVAVASATATKAAAATSAGAAGKALSIMTANKLVLGAAALAVAGGAAWYGLARDGSSSTTRAATRAPVPAVVTTAPAPAPPDAPARVRTGARKLADPAERERILASIRAAHARDEARRASAPTAPPSLGGEPADLDKEYVQASVRDLLPFLKECYTTALDQGPSFGGDIVVDFTIEGTPETGGLVTEAAIDDDGTDIDNVEFRECIRQTMFSLEIDPPTDGGSVKVSYPFMFSPG
jgi:RNA polymerase sigma factor (sigma-70 family)